MKRPNSPKCFKIFFRPIFYIFKKFKLWMVPVYVIKGFAGPERYPLTMAYIGYNKINRVYWYELVFNGDAKTVFKGYCFLPVAVVLINLLYKECGFIVCDSDRGLGKNIKEHKLFKIPHWMRMQMDLSQPISSMKKINWSSYRHIERYIRKYGYHYKISTQDKDFQYFYHHMYKPYAQKRFGQGAEIHTYSQVFKKERPTQLYLIYNDSQLVGGGTVEFKKNKTLLGGYGVLAGSQEYIGKGFYGAFYYLIINDLQKKGYKNLQVGGTRPFLNDGVTRFKIHLLSTVDHTYQYKSNEYAYFIPGKLSPGLKWFLTENPFICLDSDDTLTAVIWLDAGSLSSEERFKKICTRINRLNLKNCQVNLLNEQKVVFDFQQYIDSENIIIQLAGNSSDL